MSKIPNLLLVGSLAIAVVVIVRAGNAQRSRTMPDRQEVVFWHFWGGRDRPVVEDVVRRFNASQQRYFVRAIAMPGNNLDLKFFLSIAGEDPPDLVNQDDPIVADWAHRGALLPIDELAGVEETEQLRRWLYPAARELGEYDRRFYALCNGLDVRALYYNETVLAQHGLSPPQTLAELDHAAAVITPSSSKTPPARYGYLPDPRRIWAWGIVFCGRFYDESTGRVTADSEPIVRALDWMAGYSRRYGRQRVERFRTGDQALTGAAFPLLVDRRYAMIMDGQWRVRDIAEYQQAKTAVGEPADKFGVVPLPPPEGGLSDAGWVNGNFFVVPRGARCPHGAWQFMKFWSGFNGHEAEAARACAAGGWIPASPQVVRQPAYQQFLSRYPLFRTFTRLADSPNQRPTPAIPAATYYQQQVESAAQAVMYRGADPREELSEATRRVQLQLDRLRSEHQLTKSEARNSKSERNPNTE